MFLGNNGVATFRSQRFRRISETCCSTVVIPPLEWDFPVYNTHKIIGQRIRNYVANGNMLILTGGILSVEFINRYFFYNIEVGDGNYSPGPYYRLADVPICLKVSFVTLLRRIRNRVRGCTGITRLRLRSSSWCAFTTDVLLLQHL